MSPSRGRATRLKIAMPVQCFRYALIKEHKCEEFVCPTWWCWAFSQHADTDLALKALRRAYDHRRPPPGLMFHSDQGCQYTSTRFLAELRARGTIQSMSRRGNCWDNAVVERFFRSLKNEWIGDQLYVDHRHAEQDITDYLVDFYNHRRLHSAAKGLPPARFEALAAYPGAVSKVA